MAKSINARIEENLKKCRPMDTPCLLWIGRVSPDGRPRMTYKKKTRFAYRVLWEVKRGPIPEDMTIDHLCRNKRCMNIDHFEVVTVDENRRRALEEDESHLSRSNGEAKLLGSLHTLKILSHLLFAEEEKPDLRQKDIQHVVDRFQELFGNPKTSRYDRFAAKRLINKFGEGVVIKVIEAMAATKDERYAPIITSVSQLENKWLSVGAHLRRMSENKEVIVE